MCACERARVRVPVCVRTRKCPRWRAGAPAVTCARTPTRRPAHTRGMERFLVTDETAVDYETALIWRIVEAKCMREVLKLKVDHSFFFGAQAKAAFIWLRSYFDNPEYNDTPSIPTFRGLFPGFPYLALEDSTRAIVDHMRSDVLYSEISEAQLRVNQLAVSDPAGALDLFGSLAAGMRSRHHVDNARTMVSLIEQVRENYLRQEANPTGLKGWALPWPALNEATMGAQRGHLGVIWARPKRKKTWGLVAIAQALSDQGLPGIIFSQELPVIEMAERVVATTTKVNFSKFLRGKLPPHVRDEFLQDLEVFSERPNVVIDRLDGTGDAAVAELFAKVEEHGAQWWVLDAAYKLGMDDWRDLAKVTSALKAGNLNKDVFGLMTSQGKPAMKGKHEGSGDDMAYGQAFQVDCDWGIHFATDVEDLQARRITATLAFIRNGLGTRWHIRSRLCEDMGQIGARLPFNEGQDEEDMEQADVEADEMVDALTQDFVNPASQVEH